jgi:hypothetical protein
MTRMSDEAVPGSDWEDDPGDEIDDDFLYHLYQGGDLLRANRVVEAKDHLEKAFMIKPANPRGQNLLGLVYFKLGLFHRAIEIYRDLVQRFPQDPTLWVNLAMVHVKTDQLDEAERELMQAVSLSPEHTSANRYLGLVLARKGETEAAKEHFVKAGVKNVEQLIVSQAGEELPEQRQEEIRQAQRQALAEVADQGFRELEASEIPFRSAGPGSKQTSAPPPGSTEDVGRVVEEQWQTQEAGREAGSPPDAAAGFALVDGKLEIRCRGLVHCRVGMLSWVEGDLRFRHIAKRFGGQETRHLFDRAERAIVAVEGDGLLRLEPAEGQIMSLFDNAGESGYFLEELVVAFGDTPSWENGRLPSAGGGDLPIFHLFSKARLVLGCSGPIVRRPVQGGHKIRLKADRLVGWLGNLVPRLYEAEPPLVDELWIELSGDGEILCLV